MNFFFGYNDDIIKSKISIPKFQSSGKYDKSIKLFSADIENSRWIIKQEKLNESTHFLILSQITLTIKKYFLLHKKMKLTNI